MSKTNELLEESISDVTDEMTKIEAWEFLYELPEEIGFFEEYIVNAILEEYPDLKSRYIKCRENKFCQTNNSNDEYDSAEL